MTSRKRKLPRQFPWYLAWLIQAALMTAMGLIGTCAIALNEELGALPYQCYLWGISPLAGLVSAYRTTLRGLNNYLAWLAPPACVWLTHALLTGYSPAAAPVLVCAFCSLMGAAAGEVMRRRLEKNTAQA